MVKSARLVYAGLQLWRARIGSRRQGARLDAELVGENSLGEAIAEIQFFNEKNKTRQNKRHHHAYAF